MQFSVLIQLSRNSGETLSAQVANRLSEAIAMGKLGRGEKLPSVRMLSELLKVSPATVVSAYRELVRRGFAVPHARSGFRVAERPFPRAPSDFLDMHRIQPFLPIHPVSEFGRILAELGADPETGGYEEYRGHSALRREAARLAEGKGIAASERNILISAGTQQAIYLASCLLSPGDRVILEQPCYPGAKLAFESAGAVLLPVQMGKTGPDLALVESYAKEGRLAMMYANPGYQNPTGYSYDGESRKGLLTLAEEYDFLVFEDDFLGDLDYLGEKSSRLKSLDTRGRVIYSSTFSKCLLPSLRIASVIAGNEIIDRMTRIKTRIDICGSAFLERALALFLTRGLYEAHLQRVRPHYLASRRAMSEALERFRGRVDFTEPLGGLSVFCRVLSSVKAIGGRGGADIVQACRREGLLVAAGEDYFIDPAQGAMSFRLGFGNLPPECLSLFPEKLEAALERLGSEMSEAVL